jgi:hypothetical protein
MADPSDDDKKPGNKQLRADATTKGKPKRRRLKPGNSPAETPLSVIEGELLRTVEVAMDGNATKMTAMRAIMYQLLQKSLSGDAKADRTLQSYQDFADRHTAPSRLEIEFVDNEYTRALAKGEEDEDV